MFFGDLPAGDLQFIEVVIAGFIDARRLAGGTKEQAGEKVP